MAHHSFAPEGSRRRRFLGRAHHRAWCHPFLHPYSSFYPAACLHRVEDLFRGSTAAAAAAATAAYQETKLRLPLDSKSMLGILRDVSALLAAGMEERSATPRADNSAVPPRQNKGSQEDARLCPNNRNGRVQLQHIELEVCYSETKGKKGQRYKKVTRGESPLTLLLIWSHF